MKRLLLILTSLCAFVACNTTEKRTENSAEKSQNVFKYAQHIFSQEGSDSVTIYFQQNGVTDSVVYVLGNSIEPSKTTIQTPSKRLAPLATTDVAMIAMLGCEQAITGMCEPLRISNECVSSLFRSGKIKDIGTSFHVNSEALTELNPDAIISTIFSPNNLTEFDFLPNTPVIFNMSWCENSPLARLEWIKLFGMLTNKRREADSIFAEIEHRYDSLKTLANSVAKKPIVLAGAADKNVWYMPGGKSYVASFIADAGGDFVGKSDENFASVIMNFEHILELSQTADLWIGCDQITFTELLAANSNYSLLPQFQNKQVFHRSKQINAFGGNDYWELGYVRPDIVLADYIWAIQPECMPNYEPIFIDKVH